MNATQKATILTISKETKPISPPSDTIIFRRICKHQDQNVAKFAAFLVVFCRKSKFLGIEKLISGAFRGFCSRGAP